MVLLLLMDHERGGAKAWHPVIAHMNKKVETAEKLSMGRECCLLVVVDVGACIGLILLPACVRVCVMGALLLLLRLEAREGPSP